MHPDRKLDAVADIACVIYRVHFYSADALAAAATRLQGAGFEVTQPADSSGFALEARMTAEVSRADHALDRALSAIDHDPLIEWQRSRLTGFV
jgi:hypothetical protein